MNTQRSRIRQITQNLSIPSLTNNFLNRANYTNIYQLRNVQILANQSRNGVRLIGRDLINQNVEFEARRLQMYSRKLINSATYYIWSFFLTQSERNQFINLANNANNINQSRILNSPIDNTVTLDLIARITTPQNIDNPLGNNFLNGTNFIDNNDIESSFLPAGFV
ncbi:hypothetical protein C1645_833965 [Glomus cerebriforme]|uniref:Uncharacterized protein n=1 Tax=Glomus cerebriforme TaxID=658196 RepID=A0A397SAJ9_9GLOM|nr:hypothetical protein C1645_833965 [Glomus cerebriforme]